MLDLLAAMEPSDLMLPAALLMLAVGAAALLWPLFAGGEGRGEVKRRLKVDEAPIVVKAAAPAEKRAPAVMGDATAPSCVIDATDRFRARGGTWTPSSELRRRIEAAACGRVSTSRARVLG